MNSTKPVNKTESVDKLFEDIKEALHVNGKAECHLFVTRNASVALRKSIALRLARLGYPVARVTGGVDTCGYYLHVVKGLYLSPSKAGKTKSLGDILEFTMIGTLGRLKPLSRLEHIVFNEDTQLVVGSGVSAQQLYIIDGMSMYQVVDFGDVLTLMLVTTDVRLPKVSDLAQLTKVNQQPFTKWIMIAPCHVVLANL